MKRIIKDYFTFSKKERVAMVILLLLIAVFIMAPYFYSPKYKPPVVNKALSDYLLRNKILPSGDDSTDEHMRPAYSSDRINSSSKSENFLFDPNTVSENDWKRLGISDKTIRTIINYRNKGGKFRIAEDIRKIWGMRKGDADRLIPLIQIDQTSFHSEPNTYFGSNTPPVTHNKITTIDINTATPEEWKSLPGIGEVLANRIVKFRERIGGFKAIEQVKKTYGISDSVFQTIRPFLVLGQIAVSGLDINTASAYDLRSIAGIPEPVARAIVVYRQQYGPYQSVADLKKIVFIHDTLYQRIAPNLRVE